MLEMDWPFAVIVMPATQSVCRSAVVVAAAKPSFRICSSVARD